MLNFLQAIIMTALFFFLAACSNSGDGGSIPATTTKAEVTIPETPTSQPNVTVISNGWKLSWQAISGATYYRVFKDGLQVSIGETQTNTFRDINIAGNYTYTVCNRAGCSAHSPVANVSSESVVIGNQIIPTANDVGSSASNPAYMPTISDYNIPVGGAKRFIYLQKQTNSSEETTYLVINADGTNSFFGANYFSVTDFFNDKGVVYGGVACDIFGITSGDNGLYVGKTGTCNRSYTKNGSTGTSTQNWKVESLVDVKVFGTAYKALKITYDIINTVNGNWISTNYFVPDLLQYVVLEGKKKDGTLTVRLTLTSIQ